MNAKDLSNKLRHLRMMLEAKLGVKSHSFAQAIKRAGRRLPKKHRAQAQLLIDAEQKAEIPKLAPQLDWPAIEAAYAAIAGYLRDIDVVEQRKDRRLGLAGTIAFNLLAVVFLFVLWLWWRGYV